jgi:hypothetical protein
MNQLVRIEMGCAHLDEESGDGALTAGNVACQANEFH